jgi:hypothetical protein
MRRLNILLFFSLLTSASYAQFVNNGATVTIQAGATLRVETNFVNNAGGTITNNGTLEVQNDFTNAGTFNSGSTSTVKFIGTTNSNVTPGGATMRNVSLEKTAQNITLLGPLAINGDLNFVSDNNKVILGNHNLTINTGGAVVSADANEYVVTNGTGQLVKGIDANGTITHEIGDLTNYTPVSNQVVGSAYASATLGARVYTTAMQAKYNDATDYINREWLVVASGITSYDNTLTGTYADGDIVGTESLIKGSTYHSPSPDWKFINAAGNATLNTVTARAINPSPFDVKLSGQNFFGKANLKAYLAGALPSGTTMTTALNSLLPTTQTPYTAAPFNAPSLTGLNIVKPANATDWILVEVRDASNPATVISQTSGFILSDGTIVSYDNQPLRLKNAVANGHIALRHRNHLAIRTAMPLNLVEPPTLKDFSAGTSEAFTNGAITNANMRQIGSVFAMWGGNVLNDAQILYNGGGNDRIPILSLVGGTANANTPLINQYTREDCNLDSSVIYNGAGSDRVFILSTVGGTANANLPIQSHF